MQCTFSARPSGIASGCGVKVQLAPKRNRKGTKKGVHCLRTCLQVRSFPDGTHHSLLLCVHALLSGCLSYMSSLYIVMFHLHEVLIIDIDDIYSYYKAGCTPCALLCYGYNSNIYEDAIVRVWNLYVI